MAPRKPVKWTPDKIAEIEALRAEGKSWRDISKHFGVTSSGGIFTIYHKYKPDGSWRPPAVWQPISTAPKDVAILVYGNESEGDLAEFGQRIAVAKYRNDLSLASGNKPLFVYAPSDEKKGESERCICPSHWMHLPHSPTVGEKNNGNG